MALFVAENGLKMLSVAAPVVSTRLAVDRKTPELPGLNGFVLLKLTFYTCSLNIFELSFFFFSVLGAQFQDVGNLKPLLFVQRGKNRTGQAPQG